MAKRLRNKTKRLDKGNKVYLLHGCYDDSTKNFPPGTQVTIKKVVHYTNEDTCYIRFYERGNDNGYYIANFSRVKGGKPLTLKDLVIHERGTTTRI